MGFKRTITVLIAALIATSSFFSSNVFASSINGLTKDDFVNVANEYGLNPKLLYSIAVVESSMLKGSEAKPWPYVINKNGKPYYLVVKTRSRKNTD